MKAAPVLLARAPLHGNTGTELKALHFSSEETPKAVCRDPSSSRGRGEHRAAPGDRLR